LFTGNYSSLLMVADGNALALGHDYSLKLSV
jgi:hypothetical protein